MAVTPRRSGFRRLLAATTFAFLSAGCDGEIFGGGTTSTTPGPGPSAPPSVTGGPGPTTTPPQPQPEVLAQVLTSGIRRLTAAEFTLSVRNAAGVTLTGADQVLIDGVGNPFENASANKAPSATLVAGLLDLAETAAAQPPPALSCTLSTTARDPACERTSISAVARRLLRRTATAAEVQELLALGSNARSAREAYGLALEALLVHPETVYRLEVGAGAVAGDFALTGEEVASRLSFLFTGAGPSDALLDAAERGELATSDGVLAQARVLLASAEAQNQALRYHAQLLSYGHLPFEASLAASARRETDALVLSAVKDQAPLRSLLTASTTVLDPAMATLYGADVAADGSGPTYRYRNPLRAGILGHASVLSNGKKGDDTSPTQRGIFVLKRLLCEEIGAPPPGVDPDKVPAGITAQSCKTERYRAHASGSCAGCHARVDGIGFGLENFDTSGRYRTAEAANPACTITGDGTIPPGTTFRGPKGLGAFIAEDPRYGACMATQLVRFATGRAALDENDRLLASNVGHHLSKDFTWNELLLGLVASPAFLRGHTP
ncbi:MAG: DUF1588 domain-containing protein [Myxococcaceae bacterium]|nr:DUF1588 domain-containing protein [Myxococcaceae bacterium]